MRKFLLNNACKRIVGTCHFCVGISMVKCMAWVTAPDGQGFKACQRCEPSFIPESLHAAILQLNGVLHTAV